MEERLTCASEYSTLVREKIVYAPELREREKEVLVITRRIAG